MGGEMDADSVTDELYNDASALANSQPTMKDQLGHLRDRGVSVLMSDHMQNQQQQSTNSHGMTGNLSYDNNLGKGNQTQQQRHIEQLLYQQRGQQQRAQQQVQFAALQSGVIKAKNKVLNSAKTVSNKKTKTKRRKQSALNSSNDSLSEIAANITPSNQFALLSELDITYANNVAYESTPTVNNCNPASNSDSNNMPNSTPRSAPNGSDNQNSAQIKFCPPIIIYNIDIGKLVLEFKNKFPNIELKIVNCSRFRSKLYIKGIQAYNAVMGILKEKKINSHSFTPTENKQISLIIRGLHYNTLSDEIKNELNAMVPNMVSDVRTFETPFMKKNNIRSDLFSVTLFPGKSPTDVVNIKHLLFQRIFWEKPKSSSREVQCKRCQRWGHLAKNCNHSYQCVKCDKSHEPGQCALIKEENSKSYCVNCKKWGHPANFRRCEAHLALLEQRKLRQSRATPTTHTMLSNSFITPKKSFASLFNTRSTNASNGTPKSGNSKLIEEFLLVAKQLLDTDPISIESRIQNFLQNFRSLSAEDKKSECLKILRDLENTDG